MTGQVAAFNVCAFASEECVMESLCKELCNRIESHLPPCAAHRLSTVPNVSQQHWQLGRDRANFVSLEKKVGLHLVNLFTVNCNVCLKKEQRPKSNHFLYSSI